MPTYQGRKLWYGWAKLDGHRGAEVLLTTHTDDFFTVRVLTWQGGKLRFEKSPSYPGETKHYAEWSADTEDHRTGFRLFTEGGKRFVNVWLADCPDSGTGNCTVKTKRSVWKNGAWRTTGAVTTSVVDVANITARAPFGALVIHT